eukprot:CAMPEP_0114615004 /NCGR_PEP_ID=MMETSP0168-20121206/5943_1 /TAXON_ID=95228 ORGANISM="Vannella sp., Strain DIVA3 517/6/12" /NCGR_SAMPLE_ID=MMETSP0168 /ASSEMBLY_ACC=CAM_ASM_000044 /LENGTH=165 /DNA_ID=CAMNT_0001826065 /DNA_START=36 /DNA_END=533 /DNA_ORIENTATION=+
MRATTVLLLAVAALVLLQTAAAFEFQNKPQPRKPSTLDRGQQEPKFREGVRLDKERKTSEEVFFNPHEFVAEQLSVNEVTVFSKSYCPYCKRAKGLLDKLGVKYTAVEMDVIPNGADVQRALLQSTGQRTVPNVFFGKKHIGGYDSLNKLNQEGQLLSVLEQNKA